jgi:hypothetical protein
MYQKPALQRFGSLRELTLIGTDANGDGGIDTFFGTVVDGCNLIPSGDCSRS